MNEWVFLACIAGVIAVCVLWCRFYVGVVKDSIKRTYELEMAEWKERERKTIGSKSVQASRNTIKGQLAEQFFPFTDKCNFRPSDLQFIGKGFDFVGIIGYTDCKDFDPSLGGKRPEIKEIVFIEIKYGKSKLSAHQALIKKAIDEKKVRWETVTIQE